MKHRKRLGLIFKHSIGIATVLLCLPLAGCGDGDTGVSPTSGTPAATSTPTETRTYSISGTVNGQAAAGALILRVDSIGANVINYSVAALDFDELHGCGKAQYSTLYRTLDIVIGATVTVAGNTMTAALAGQAHGVQAGQGSLLPQSIQDITLSGVRVTIMFSTVSS